jgi:nucleoside-diphosphate-sugar epimerase
MTVAITGANGFIGSALVRHFSQRGCSVLALCRRPQDQSPLPHTRFIPFAMAESIRESELEGGDVLIHCAFVPHAVGRPDATAINVRGTERLLEVTRRLGYAKFVFLSSLSVLQGARSHYARHKRELEGIFDLERDLIVRPGLTLGKGGLAQTIVRVIRTSRVVPLIGGGQQPVYTIGVDDLCSALHQMIEHGVSGAYSVAAPEPVTMRELYRGLADRAGVRCTFLPVPYLPAFWALKAIEAIGIELSITTENLLGLEQLRVLDLAADLRALGVHPKPFAEAVQMLDLS